MEIKVFKREVEDGIAEVIRAKASIAFTSEIVPDNKWVNIAKASADFIKNYKFNADINTVDLFPFNSVLASAGMNRNLDFFPKAEIWKARYSPIHKPVNWMHNDEIIIGNMIGSVAIDKDRNVIPDDTPLDKLPDLFDIAVCAVIYKCFSSETKAALINEILEKINKNELYVSMECIFPTFDYVLIAADGTQKIVARNEETAFLSKYLKQYGGEGVYDNHQIGRVLKDLIFTGKGIVDNPANPRSIIFDDLEVFNGSQASIKVEQNMDLETLKAELAKAQAEIASLKNANSAKAQEELAKEVEALKVKIGEITKASEDKTTVINTQSTTIASLEEENKKIMAENETFKAEAEKAKKEKKAADRMAKLANAGVAEDKRADILTKYDAVADEIFDDLVAALAAAASVAAKKTEETEKAKASTQADFTKAEKQTDATLTTPVADTNADVAKARASVASFLGNKVFKTTANQKDKE